MCFTPQISFATAFIEFFVGLYIYLTSKRVFFVKLLVVFVYLLGLYQFSEFMLCSSEQAALWAKVGFLAYNFLPVVGFHFVISYVKKRFPNWILYVPPVAFAAVAIFAQSFVAEATCGTFFVTVKTLFFREFGGLALMSIYWAYYFGYILAATLILIFEIFKKGQKKHRLAYSFVLLSVIISLFPAVILIVVLSSTRVMFPSIYCEFALLFALIALVGVRKSKEFQK